ncbi:tetratricopeptide repeat-containing protein kinase family protein [Streptomyces acidiscabies]|uniref:tetratricopeptide repeat-containing protein kinase family protein n=1 Tax=Streptomyces acidiscabies TaxID=42234 RepID=UPI00131B559D|nr:tetratricopeptide repeat-containing protein kinase family protein [Streptomyces acidiscabies]
MTKILAESGAELSHEELLDALWLAMRRGPTPLARAIGVPETPPVPVPQEPPAPTPRPTPTAPPPPPKEPARPITATDDTPKAPTATTPSPALPVRTPEPRPTGQLHLGKALRPLRQRFPDRRRPELDLARTVAAIADTGIPETVTRPARTRWLSLALVIDDGVSMVLWQRLAADVRRLMERAGAFRDVRVYGLDTRAAVPTLRTSPYQRGRDLSPKALCDPSGNTLVLVISDGVGSGWRDGGMRGVLDRWGRCGPVAIVHALPGRLWAGTGIDVRPARVTSHRRGGPTHAWQVSDPDLPLGLAHFDSVPVPVLTPTPQAVGEWSRLLASPGGTAVLPLWEGRTDVMRTVVEVPEGDAVLRFREAASAEAYRLAAHVAAVAPVTPPVMRLVQTALGEPVDAGHLMEVFLGGLMHEVDASERLPQHRRFDFSGEARRALLSAVSAGELLRTADAVARGIEDAVGRSPVFPAWVGHPDGTAVVDDTGRSFGWLREQLLVRLGVSGGEADPAPPGWSALTPDDPQRLGWFRLLWRSDRGWPHITVYLAQGRDGELVTVRAPVSLYADDPVAAVELVRTEAECLGRMNGIDAPALVDVQADTDGEMPWIASELIGRGGVPAPNLRHLLADDGGAVPRDVFLQIGLDLAWALVHAHDLGLVHGSIAPRSVLVADAGVRLIGWMTATVDGVDSPHRDLFPLTETYAGGGDVSPESDVYAAGALLLAFLAERREYPRASLDSPMDLALRVTLRHCLADQPAARPSARQLVESFTAVMDGPTSADTAVLDRLFDDIQRLEPLVRDQLMPLGPALVGRLMTFSNHLANLGRHEESLAQAEQAVRVCRALAAEAPQEYAVGLGAALNNLSVRLGELGRAEESLAAAFEAREAYEALGGVPGLAMVLNNLSNCLAAVGRREEALAAAEGAVVVGSYGDLARASTTLGNRLSELGRREEALDAFLSAVRSYDGRASADHAVTLNNLAVLYATLGRHDDALRTLDESTALQSTLEGAPTNALPQIRAQSDRIRTWLTG